MAKQTTITPDALTPAQVKTATACFESIAMAYGTGLTRFRDEVFNLYYLNGVIVADIRKELTALNRQVFVSAWKARKGKDLDLPEVEQAKASANASFSRYAAALEPPKTRTPQQLRAAEAKAAAAKALKEAQANAANGQATDPHAPAPDAPANEIQKRHFVDQVAARGKAMQSGMQKLQSLRIPASLQANIGDIAEQINKLNEDCTALLALYA